MNAGRYTVTDPAVLMAAAGDRDTFDALARTFLDCAPPIAEALRRALDGGAHAAIGQHSHALKGMTVLVGAAALTALLQRIETAARLAQAAPAEAATLAASFELVRREVALSLDDPDHGGGA
jgi:HPt (histidine-containing phosphotransfer) domain-containing protein